MKVVLRLSGQPWWTQPFRNLPAAVEPSREEKFRRLLNAALATPYYSRRDRTLRLLAATSLADLPLLTLRELFANPSQFLNPKARHASALLRLPFPTQAGVLLGRRLRTPPGVTYVPEGFASRLPLAHARTLIATPPALRRLIACVEARTLALPRLTEALIVLQSVEDGVLFPGERDMLWRTLGVPIFEQWLGLDGEPLASECGVHQGMHFHAGKAELEDLHGELIITSWHGLRTPAPRLRTGWYGEADTRLCPCGDPRPVLRILGLQRQAHPTPLTLAARA
jgi:hypothetical protein